jgi:hypothetical protein
MTNIAKFHERLNQPFQLPLSPDTICLWMADNVDQLRYSSLRTYLHGIATLQQEFGHPNPLSSPLIWRMFKAIKRIQGHNVVKQRLPITISILMMLDSHFDTRSRRQLCMRAAMWLGTCGLLRGGEFTCKSTTSNVLKVQNLTFYDKANREVDPISDRTISPHYMSVRIEQSKTDPFRQGANVVIGNERSIRYMIEYLRAREQLLRRAPLFVDDRTGLALSTSSLVQFTQSILELAKIANSDKFLGHSFRKGGATSLHEAGYPDSLIKMMGRWASFAFATYVHTPIHMLVEAGRALRNVEECAHTVTTSSSFWDVNNLE